MAKANLEQNSGYSLDSHTENAIRKIKAEIGRDDCDVHILVGGTQTNAIAISGALRPHQAAICAHTGHINVHETGAIESCGHKVLTVESSDGKITPEQIQSVLDFHTDEHMVMPKLVYISNSTEVGTQYSKAELISLSEYCRAHSLYLFLDGARLGSALTSESNDLTMADIASLCDMFYIGGTKVGALFGEAVVITNEELKQNFRYSIKQHGGMLAKGRLLGIQFSTLFTNNLYFQIAEHAIHEAQRIKSALEDKGISFLIDSYTNQQFPIFTQHQLTTLSQDFLFSIWQRIDDNHTAVRICTSWATKSENVDKLILAIRNL
jgi:threonine aldolase